MGELAAPTSWRNSTRSKPASGRLYAIIGRETFSSGMLAAFDLRDRAGAILAGEPTGGKPNGYGEVLTFELPVTRLQVSHSTKRFTKAPGDPASLEPAIDVRLSSSDYFARHDPVLESILPATTIGNNSAPTGVRRRAVSPAQPRRCERLR